MEDLRKNKNSGENKPEDPDFEFGSLTPSSPSQDPFSSPADHLFFNGRLLPHAFPASAMIVRTISRTTSEDSSRSNSTNSRSSRSSSSSSPSSYTPRTSSCSTNGSTGSGDHKPLWQNSRLKSGGGGCRGKTVNTRNKEGYAWKCKSRKATQLVTAQLYGTYSSQRWQYLTPVPGAAFKREWSAKRGANGGCCGGGGIRVGSGSGCGWRVRKKAEEKRGSSRVVRWWRRLVRAVVLACRECHAMAPERLPNDDDDDDVDMKECVIAHNLLI